MISHTLMTVRDATSILVLEGGRVVEHGSPDELVALDGVYAGLLELQDKRVGTPTSVTA